MSKRLLLGGLLMLFVFTNCRKDVFNRMEINLEGTWAFTNVSQYKYDAFAGAHSIFGAYSGDEITFKGDKTVLYKEANGDELEGIWSIRTIDATNSEGESAVAYLITIALVDTSGDLLQYVWETNTTYINNYLRVEEEKVDYRYCYELQKY